MAIKLHNSKLLQSVHLVASIATIDQLLEHYLTYNLKETLVKPGPYTPKEIGLLHIESAIQEIEEDCSATSQWELFVIGLAFLELLGEHDEKEKQMEIIGFYYL